MYGVSAGLNSLSDEQLAGLARESNEEAFALLVSRCTGMLKTLSAKYRIGIVEPDDLVQEGLLGLLSAVRTYNPSENVSFGTYAYACARNRMISSIRSRTGTEAQSLSNEDEQWRVRESAADDPASVVLRQEDARNLQFRLRSALTDLEYRVLMAHLGGFSYREIAAKLAVTDKTVDNALQRVRRKLASILYC